MLPISAIVGVSTVGYLFDQYLREKNFDENNEDSTNIPVDNINGCADQYPWNFIDSFDDVNVEQQNTNKNESFTNLNNEPSPLNPEPIISPTSINAVNNAGNPPADYLINATERPVQDFLVNNPFPFFRGNGTNQDMRGTGVAQANVLSENFNLGNDNKTPYHSTLSLFVGCDDTYFHKREGPNRFSPNEIRDRNTIPGEDASAQRPDRDRYTTSILTKPDEKPIEQIMVGPGIGIDAHMPNGGEGFNSGISTKIKPNNYNAYRLTQLPGRIAGTKYQPSNLPQALPGVGPAFDTNKVSKSNHKAWNNKKDSANNNNGMPSLDHVLENESLYGVPSKKDPLLITQEVRPMTATPALTQTPMHYSNYILPSGSNKRTVTNVSFGQSIEIK